MQKDLRARQKPQMHLTFYNRRKTNFLTNQLLQDSALRRHRHQHWHNSQNNQAEQQKEYHRKNRKAHESLDILADSHHGRQCKLAYQARGDFAISLTNLLCMLRRML